MILMIDNYDSFTYNLVQYLGELKAKVRVCRNDKISVDDIRKMNPDSIIISPGPGRPEGAGISIELIEHFAGKKPILGVCLGHQCIGYHYGAKIVCAKELMHGKTSLVYHKNDPIFKNMKNPFEATRYHSLVVSQKNFPKRLKVIARTKDKEIMALKHKTLPIWGVQFHPESILTKEGKILLKNFLRAKI